MSEKTKSTPGPWHAFLGSYGVSSADGMTVALVHVVARSEEENEANARLIAASPEMYEMLCYLTSRFKGTDGLMYFHSHMFDECQKILAKAEGTKP